MDERKKVNLGTKKTDPEWGNTLDRFFLAHTPRILEWLNWVVILAAVTYVSKRSDSYLLQALVFFCYLAMFKYFQAFFYQFEFENFPFVRGQKAQRVLSIILSALLGIGTFLIIQAAIEAIVAANH